MCLDVFFLSYIGAYTKHQCKQPNLVVKFDGFDIFLIVFHIVLLNCSVYTEANHGTLKIAF